MKKLELSDEKIKALLEDLKAKYHQVIGDQLVEIVLFGSYATGKNEKYSDLDVFVLIDCQDKTIDEFDNKLEDYNHDLTLKYEVLVSPVFVKYELYREYREVLPFYSKVEKEGVVIYERKAA